MEELSSIEEPIQIPCIHLNDTYISNLHEPIDVDEARGKVVIERGEEIGKSSCTCMHRRKTNENVNVNNSCTNVKNELKNEPNDFFPFIWNEC